MNPVLLRRPGLLVLLMLLSAPGLALGQGNEFLIPASTTETLNDIINGDTTATGDRVDPDRVYVLERGGIYLIDASIQIDAPLRLRAQEGAGTRPVIYPTQNTATANPPGNFIVMREDVWLQDLIFVGFLESEPSERANVVASVVQVSAPGFDLYIDGCLMLHNRGQFVRTNSATRVVKMTNNVFANSGVLPQTNLGAGKIIDLRDTSVDTLLMQNNTIVNFQDRVIRHLNSTGAINNLIFDHNTVINGMSYHGTLSLGWTGEHVQITNNLWVDPFALGADPTDEVRQAEFTEHGETYADGTARMVWIFHQPREGVDTRWTVGGNVYTISPEGRAFLDGIASEGVLGEGPPLSWYINRQLGDDSTTAFVEEDLALADAPTVMVDFMQWYRTPEAAGGGGRTKNVGNFDPAQHDMDRRTWEYFDQTFDASYPTTAAAYTAADGFPVGDLNWFPDRKAEWTATGVEHLPGEIPAAYRLEQNYPNPFNPSTRIEYALPDAATVTLAVYDPLGREVARLVDGQAQAAGTYAYTWHAAGLSSGVYFYQLRAGAVVLTGKMLLLK